MKKQVSCRKQHFFPPVIHGSRVWVLKRPFPPLAFLPLLWNHLQHPAGGAVTDGNPHNTRPSPHLHGLCLAKAWLGQSCPHGAVSARGGTPSSAGTWARSASDCAAAWEGLCRPPSHFPGVLPGARPVLQLPRSRFSLPPGFPSLALYSIRFLRV